MAYRHGVYTSEVSTSIQTAAPVDSALPFAIGAAPLARGPVLITSWSRYCEVFGVSPQVDLSAPGYLGGSLTKFAYYWYVLAGRSDCIMQSVLPRLFRSQQLTVKDGSESVTAFYQVSVPITSGVDESDRVLLAESLNGGTLKLTVDNGEYSAELIDRKGVSYELTAASSSNIKTFTLSYSGMTVSFTLYPASISSPVFPADVSEISLELFAGSEEPLSAGAVIDSIQQIHTIYEQFGRVASILTISPRYLEQYSQILPAAAAAVSNIGGRFKGIVVADLESGYTQYSTSVPSLADVADEKSSTSPYVVYTWPYIGVGDLRFPASVALVAAFNATDGQHGGLPYVSPSNKPLPVTGAYTSPVDGDTEEFVETPAFFTLDDVNTYLGAYGITGFRNTAQGWVAWGDNTAAFPGNTDVKDYMIPIRRMFNYVSNQFQIFADARIDLPLNMRQLEGVVKSFNQVLAGWVGFGALNAASVELDGERNTTESLLSGTVYVRIRIAPPPAMVVIEGILEYDVQGFERSLA